MIRVKFAQKLREAEMMLPVVPRKGETVSAPDGIRGRVFDVGWNLSDPDDIYVRVIID